jgi:glycosyltransferase involved in cell wall biosynthesis
LRILMLAPQPFFRARGTPFSVLQRVKGLTSLGHTVELVTYPFGEEVEIPGLVIHRAAAVPGIRDVKVGPSVSKLILDVPLFATAVRLARTGRFDLLHAHEEAAIMAGWISRRYGIPHLYDMHSSLPEQFANFERYNLRMIVGFFRQLERYTLDRADLLITVCPELEEHARREGFPRPHVMIENTLEVTGERATDSEIAALRSELGLGLKRLVVYTGTLEAYQGLELLMAAAPEVVRAIPESHFLIVGGTPEQVAELMKVAEAGEVGSHVTALPAVRPEHVPTYHQLAEVLVTCRIRGINTPLKLYQYLRAGRPIVATSIRSHTQVLDDRTAELVPANAAGIAAGIVRVLRDTARSESLAEAAARAAAERFSAEAYMTRLRWVMEQAERLVESAPASAAGSERG